MKHFMSLHRYFYKRDPESIEEFAKFQVDFNFWKEIGLLNNVLLK